MEAYVSKKVNSGGEDKSMELALKVKFKKIKNKTITDLQSNPRCGHKRP